MAETNLKMFRGDTLRLRIKVKQGSSAYNLTGAALWFTAKASLSSADGVTGDIQKTIGNGITVTDATAGTAALQLATADTSGLPASNTVLFWDIQLRDTQARIFTLAAGKLVVVPDVTRAT